MYSIDKPQFSLISSAVFFFGLDFCKFDSGVKTLSQPILSTTFILKIVKHYRGGGGKKTH